MQFVLLSNTMNDAALPAFVDASRRRYPGCHFLHAGDLLNVFPEPGEDHAGSLFFEIFGEMLPRELSRLQARGFRDPETSPLVPALHDFFAASGPLAERAQAMARERYRQLFAELAAALGPAHLTFVPGNMDYPAIAAAALAPYANLTMLDGALAEVGGLRLGGIGGIPRRAQPLHQVAAISPYEHDDRSWARQVQAVAGADIIVSHLSPPESAPLQGVVDRCQPALSVSRAPFDLGRLGGSCRGNSGWQRRAETLLVQVRPFEPAANVAPVVALHGPRPFRAEVETFAWRPRPALGSRRRQPVGGTNRASNAE